MIKALVHVCYRVRDLDRAIEFYTSKLGFVSAFEFLDNAGVRYGVYLKVAGRSFIELFTGLEDEVPQPGSFLHICLEVDDIDTAVADLRAKGVEVSDPHYGGDNSWQAWVTDPDGNRIELHSYTTDSLQAAWLD